MRRRWWLTAAAIAPLVASALAGSGPAAQASGTRAAAQAASTSTGQGPAGGPTGLAVGYPFCTHLGKSYQASSAAQIACFGAHKVTKIQPSVVPAVGGTPRNVDAASFREDVAPNGVRAFGQSETSIAAAGQYVVEAWNDSTSFFSNCGSKHFKEEVTGIGFSANGGKTFTDLGGLPNPGCNVRFYGGDPSVTAYRVGGRTFFYIFSLYLPTRFNGQTHVAFDPCEVIGSGSAARLHCGRPVVAASSTQCLRFRHNRSFCSFLDKDFATIDPVRGRLYVTYSEFGFLHQGNPPVELAMCDIGNKSGHAGPAGGTPARPVCKHGTPLVKTTMDRGRLFVGKPYFTVAGPGRKGCENEGSYPAVNLSNGNLYVGYEYNWFTNLFFSRCFSSGTKTRVYITKTSRHCLKMSAVAACTRPGRRNRINVTSMDAAFIPGNLRFPQSDFPRVAVSQRFGTVSMAWNDARFHPNGDILLQSFKLGSLGLVQPRPTVLDRPHKGGLAFLPGLRVASRSGRLDVAWYSRSSPRTANTSVKAAIGVNPRTTATPRNVFITNKTSDWLVNNSDIVPNFGDYIDTVVSVTNHWPFVGRTLYVAWSDGRSGVPQPFAAHMSAG
jgi:hypothetical protein